MSAPAPQPPAPPADGAPSSLVRVAIWVAIGALVAAALVCVVWVLVGTANGIVGRAFLTILLLAAFAGVAILDAHLAPRRPAWFALTSMIVWVVTLLIGAILIWMREPAFSFGLGRLFSFLVIVLLLQLGVLHVRLYMKSFERHITPLTRAIAYLTIGLIAVLEILLILPLMFSDYVDFSDPYGRVIVAVTILAAVGTALIPLMNVLFAPKAPRPVFAGPSPSALLPWPTYVDGVTPLPVLPDGSPDWNAYYTGYPSTVPQAIAPVATQAVPPPPEVPAPGTQLPAPVAAQPAAVATGWVAPVSPAPAPHGYQGYPPPPPLPPQQ